MKKFSKNKKILLSILTIIIIIVGSISAYTYYLSNKIERVKVDREDVINTGKEVPKEADDVITIALFGSDFSDIYDVSAADATMLLAIDTKNNEIKLGSLMRDIYLDLPNGGKMNLNYRKLIAIKAYRQTLCIRLRDALEAKILIFLDL